MSLDEYWKLASYYVKWHRIPQLLKNDEAIGHIADALIKCDKKNGAGPNFRARAARWAIYNYVRKMKRINEAKEKTNQYQILDEKEYVDTDRTFVELVDQIENSTLLTEHQRGLILEKMRTRDSYADIARRHGVSNNAVYESINAGLGKLGW